MKPRALICLRSDKVALICAWCLDKKAADEFAIVGGYELSHTICATHAQELTKDLPGPMRAIDAKQSNANGHASDKEITEDAQVRANFIHGLQDWIKRNS